MGLNHKPQLPTRGTVGSNLKFTQPEMLLPVPPCPTFQKKNMKLFCIYHFQSNYLSLFLCYFFVSQGSGEDAGQTILKAEEKTAHTPSQRPHELHAAAPARLLPGELVSSALGTGKPKGRHSCRCGMRGWKRDGWHVTIVGGR